MALFYRERQPPSFTSSGEFKPFLRADFETRCAYCERPEEYMGGEEVFEVEHFRPRSKFPELDWVYENLYYACRGCNAHKSETWPSDELAALGMRFADPCKEDPYIHHLAEEADGSVRGKTPCGVYTAAHIRLDREEVNEWRKLRAQALRDVRAFAASVSLLERLHPFVPVQEREQLVAIVDRLKRYTEEIRLRFRVA